MAQGVKSTATIERQLRLKAGILKPEDLPQKAPNRIAAGKIGASVKYQNPSIKSHFTRQVNAQREEQSRIVELQVQKQYDSFREGQQILADSVPEAAKLLRDLVKRDEKGEFIIPGVKMQTRVKAAEIVLDKGELMLTNGNKSLNDMTYQEIQDFISTAEQAKNVLANMTAIEGEATEIQDNDRNNLE